MENRKKLGEIFVEKGILTQKTVDRMLLLSNRLNKRFGAVLEELGLIEGHELAAALAVQYSCRVVSNFAAYPFPPQLLALVPVEVAMRNHIFPLKMDKNRLALAMADPTDMRVVKNLSADSGLSITPFVATRQEVQAAIVKHYLKREAVPSEAQTVLVAEDDKLVRTIFTEFLTRNGYRVVHATDGMEAYRVVLTEKPQVVLTDRTMPKLDGYGLLDALRSDPELKWIPVIMISGAIDGDDEVMAFERGFFDIIQKPVREATLVTRVRRALQFQERKYHFS